MIQKVQKYHQHTFYKNTFYKNLDTLVKGISKNDFHDLLNLATKESFFMFNNKFYIQVNDVAMGSTLGPILANIFLSHHEEKWLSKCPIEFKPSSYRRHVDDIFVLFESSESADFANICPLNTRT